MTTTKCNACEAESDWVCRNCYHHIVLESGTRERQRDSLKMDLDRMHSVLRAFKAASRKIQRERDDAEHLLTFNLLDDPDEKIAVYKAAAETSTARLLEARTVARKVIDVWRDPDAMLAYLRGDNSKLYAVIEEMASVLNYKAQDDER